MDALVVIFEIEISGWAHYSLYNEFKKLILVALQDNTVELWDLTSRTMEGTFEGHQSKISCMQWLDN